MTVALYLWAHRREIVAALIVFLVFVLWFTIERQADHISSQNTEIAKLRVEIGRLESQIKKNQADTATVSDYLKRIEQVNNDHKTELKKNEECISHRDPDTFINRLNQLFGYCSDEAGDPADAVPAAR